MNRLLIGILDIINKLLALFLIVSSTLSGYFGQFRDYIGTDYGDASRAIGAVVGFIAGLVLAGLVSGFIAAVITISKEAMAIRELLLVRPTLPTQPPI